MKTVCINILFVLLFPLTVLAADEETPVDGEAVETEASAPAVDHSMLRQQGVLAGYQPLTVAGQEIDATYLEETLGEEHGVIVFFHDRGDQFENEVITDLRQQMPQYGWSTLTLALDYPYVPKVYLSAAEDQAEQESGETVETEQAVEATENTEESTTEEKNELPPVSNIERMEAAFAFIQSKNIERIIFIGHGLGGETAVELLAKLTTKVSALILLNMPKLKTSETFETLHFPIVDVIGTNDSEDIALAVNHRKKIMKKAGNDNYEIREILGADHVFYGLKPMLESTIRSWLYKHFVEQPDE